MSEEKKWDVNQKIKILGLYTNLTRGKIGKALGYTSQAISQGVAESKRLHILLNLLLEKQAKTQLEGKYFLELMNKYSER